MMQTITFSVGCRRLVGVLHYPALRRPPVVVGAHGLLGTRNSGKQVALAEACCAAGIAFLRFDHRGCGESDPLPDGSDVLSGRVADLTAAAAWVRANPTLGDDLGLFGSSMGGAACLAASAALAPTAIVTWAAPVTSNGIDAKRPEAQPRPGWRFQPFDLTHRLSGVRSICVAHGDRDAVVPVDHARVIYAGVDNPKRLAIYPDTGHRMSRPTHHHRFSSETVAWFKRFLRRAPS